MGYLSSVSMMVAVTMSTKLLDAAKIAATANQLSRRVFERFPVSGLYAVSVELSELGVVAQDAAANIARPMYSVRIAVGVLIALILGILVSMIWAALPHVGQIAGASPVDVVAAVEAGTNEVVLIGLAIFFLVNLETRIKRSRAIQAIHELRSIAHVIDMHQLTKDPAQFRHHAAATDSSPVRVLTLTELIRYLDYCSEMLSVTSKIAAIYVQKFNDVHVLAAVSDVETLCTGLSGKMWQKLQVAEDALDATCSDDGIRSSLEESKINQDVEVK